MRVLSALPCKFPVKTQSPKVDSLLCTGGSNRNSPSSLFYIGKINIFLKIHAKYCSECCMSIDSFLQQSVNLPMFAKLVGSEVGIRMNPAARLC